MSRKNIVYMTDYEIEAVMAVALNGASWEAILSICEDDYEARRLTAAFERGMAALATATADRNPRVMRGQGV